MRWRSIGIVFALVLAPAFGVWSAEDEHAPAPHNASAVPQETSGHGADAGHGGEGGHAEGHHGPPHIPNLISVIGWIPGVKESAAYHLLDRFTLVFFSCLIGIGLSLFFGSVSRKLQIVPSRKQSFAELVIEGLFDFFTGIFGSREMARRHIPLVGTLFIYIWCSNMLALIPLGHSPTGGAGERLASGAVIKSALNTTAALAIVVFLYVQTHGLRELGILGYVHHLMGSPRSAIEWALVPMMLPLHILGEFIKPFSLAMRLFGNITGEDTLIAAFAVLGVTVLVGLTGGTVGIPLHLPFMFLSVLLGTIQALVFSLLAAIYISQMSHHHEEHHEGGMTHEGESHAH